MVASGSRRRRGNHAGGEQAITEACALGSSAHIRLNTDPERVCSEVEAAAAAERVKLAAHAVVMKRVASAAKRLDAVVRSANDNGKWCGSIKHIKDVGSSISIKR